LTFHSPAILVRPLHSIRFTTTEELMHFPKTLVSSLLASAVAITPLLSRAQSETAHKVKHVLLISVDGMHALDLTNYVAAHPNSAFGQLSKTGITYDNASTSLPSDSFPGLAALVTGASPINAGLWYDVTYNRRLSPPATTTPYGIVGGASLCPSVRGTHVGFDEEIDTNYLQLNGGGGINPQYLPRDPDRGCSPVYPHQYLKVNTIFEVIKAAGMHTAWSDKHPSYEWVNGPSGNGVDDFYGPEINSIPVALPSVQGCNPLPDPANATPSNAWTDSIANIKCYDSLKVNAVLHQIDGMDHSGTHHTGVPAIFGMNFQAVSVGEKLKGNGYTDVLGTPSVGLAGELDYVNNSLQLMIDELKSQGIYDDTLVIIAAKHGQSPIDPSKRTAIDARLVPSIVGAGYAFDISDDGSLIWLTDPELAPGVVSTLSNPANQEALGIQEIFAGPSMRTKFNDPGADDRTPDIILKTNTGVIFTGGSKIAEHGGLNEDDYHAALLLSNPSFSRTHIKTPVLNQQVASTILEALGLKWTNLQGAKKEDNGPLPFFPY
jgi:hypothetical protein